VRHLTRLSQKDNIVMTSARPPLDLKHLHVEVTLLAFASDAAFIFESKPITFSVNKLPPLFNAILLLPRVG
jgi:hypothetical protein